MSPLPLPATSHPPPGGEEDIQNSLQEKAQLAGGFAAPAAALALEELGVGTPAGWLNRGLLLQVRRATGWATGWWPPTHMTAVVCDVLKGYHRMREPWDVC